jgi:hypothetical protein
MAGSMLQEGKCISEVGQFAGCACSDFGISPHGCHFLDPPLGGIDYCNHRNREDERLALDTKKRRRTPN